ncbi:unnamed protein product [Danaus chrysippus]|uniref:(African queen) hypothetical protein n=1 Tax=Danaus chrysippus TaxID=151541 RepID=A0A8J2VZD4_9NEOP|nr:unnamed protein product [Danaus chrysippus]
MRVVLPADVESDVFSEHVFLRLRARTNAPRGGYRGFISGGRGLILTQPRRASISFALSQLHIYPSLSLTRIHS